MKININVKEIEFVNGDAEAGFGARRKIRGAGSQYNFHEKMRFKKAFEFELNRLFIDEAMKDSSSLIKRMTSLRNETPLGRFDNINYIKDVDAGEYSLQSRVKDPFLEGKALANSIFLRFI